MLIVLRALTTNASFLSRRDETKAEHHFTPNSVTTNLTFRGSLHHHRERRAGGRTFALVGAHHVFHIYYVCHSYFLGVNLSLFAANGQSPPTSIPLLGILVFFLIDAYFLVSLVLSAAAALVEYSWKIPGISAEKKCDRADDVRDRAGVRADRHHR